MSLNLTPDAVAIQGWVAVSLIGSIGVLGTLLCTTWCCITVGAIIWCTRKRKTKQLRGSASRTSIGSRLTKTARTQDNTHVSMNEYRPRGSENRSGSKAPSLRETDIELGLDETPPPPTQRQQGASKPALPLQRLAATAPNVDYTSLSQSHSPSDLLPARTHPRNLTAQPAPTIRHPHSNSERQAPFTVRAVALQSPPTHRLPSNSPAVKGPPPTPTQPSTKTSQRSTLRSPQLYSVDLEPPAHEPPQPLAHPSSIHLHHSITSQEAPHHSPPSHALRARPRRVVGRLRRADAFDSSNGVPSLLDAGNLPEVVREGWELKHGRRLADQVQPPRERPHQTRRAPEPSFLLQPERFYQTVPSTAPLPPTSARATEGTRAIPPTTKRRTSRRQRRADRSATTPSPEPRIQHCEPPSPPRPSHPRDDPQIDGLEVARVALVMERVATARRAWRDTHGNDPTPEEVRRRRNRGCGP